jgi:hypothetical protein
MAGNIHALGLISVVLLTGIILLRFGRRPKSIAHVAGGVAAAFGVFLLVACRTTVLYREANPIHQWLIPSICLALVLVVTEWNRICATAAVAIALSAFVLSLHYLSLLGPDASYTGSPYWARRATQVRSLTYLKVIKRGLLEAAGTREDEFPPGWVAESGLTRFIPDEDRRYLKSRSIQIHTFWHSAFTGLHGKKYHDLELWYPGGRLKEGIGKLHFRPR